MDPYLKLINGCPIRVRTNDHQIFKEVKGTAEKFKGVKLKQDKSMNIKLWNGYKVYTVKANDDLQEHSGFPSKNFQVTVKFPLGSSKNFLT